MATPDSDSTLTRVVPLSWLLLYGLGATVGAGIYILIGAVARQAGSWAPASFLVASLLAVFTAFSVAELASRHPRAGGAMVYVEAGLGWRGLAVAVGLGTAAAGTISAAAVSRGFVAYASDLASIPEVVGLTTVVVGVGAIAAWGVRESMIAAGLVTLIEIGGLIAVVLFGGLHLASPDSAAQTTLTLRPPIESPAIAVLSSIVLCFYAFLGFEDMVNVAEEVKDPARVMPRAIVGTLVASTVLYALVAAISVRVVAPEELARAAAPLSLVFERSGGRSEVLSLIALVAMLNGALVQVVMASRVLFSLARDGSLPRWLAVVHPRTRTPVASTILVTVAVGILVVLFPIERLAAATASVALAVFLLVNLSLIAIHWRERGVPCRSPFHVHGAVPVCGALSSFGFLAGELWTRLVST